MNFINFEDDLLSAKKKIKLLLLQKYSLEDDEYNETEDTNADSDMMTVIDNLQKLNKQLYLVNGMIRTDPENPTRYMFVGGDSGYANTIKGIKEIQQILQNINSILKSLVLNIGYVEPGNITKFYETVDEIINSNIYVNYNFIMTDRTKLIYKKGSNIKYDEIFPVFDVIINEMKQLLDYRATIQRTYNYQQNTIGYKKSGNSSNYYNNNDEEEDDELEGGNNFYYKTKYNYLSKLRRF